MKAGIGTGGLQRGGARRKEESLGRVTKGRLVLIAGALALSGCATSRLSYAPPKATQFANTKSVSKPFDVVWDALVKELSRDFFVINNIDKNSRLINISFSSQRRSEFVDCGVSTRKFSNLRGDQTFTYNPADPANFTMTNDMGHGFYVRRTTRLEGRTNIYVGLCPAAWCTKDRRDQRFASPTAPLRADPGDPSYTTSRDASLRVVAPEGGGANVTVNTKYVISVAVTATGFDGRPAGTENAVFDLSTKQSYTGDKSVTCYALGTLEQRILGFVR